MSRRRNQKSEQVEADAGFADELVEKNLVPASDELVPTEKEGEPDAEDAGDRSGDAEGDRTDEQSGQRPGGTVTGVNYANFNGASVEVDLD
jgi:hypothetical protein